MDGKDQKSVAQNRLLILAGLLSFFYYAEAKIEGVSLVGAKIQFNNEAAILHFGWLIWLYYYLRTYQYFVESGAKAYRKIVDIVYMEELGHLVAGISKHDFKLIPADDGLKSSLIRIQIFGGPQRRAASSLAWILSSFIVRLLKLLRISKPRPRNGPIRFNLLRPFGQGRFLRFLNHPKWFNPHAVVYPPSSRYVLQGQEKHYIELPAGIVLKLASIHFRAMTMRPAFAENYGPLLIGLIPVFYVTYLNRESMIWISDFFASYF